jgi:hypothetical protein
MELSAVTNRSTDVVDLLAGPGTTDLRLVADLDADGGAIAFDAAAAGDRGSLEPGDSVVVHVQLRPRRPAVRKCLAALAALAAEHESVGFALTGLSKDDRIVRVTVGIDLGSRAGIAKFSDAAQAAYAFVDAVFTQLYDHMPVYAAEPTAAERSAAVGVLAAVSAPRPTIPMPRRGGTSTPPAASPAVADRRGVPVPA